MNPVPTSQKVQGGMLPLLVKYFFPQEEVIPKRQLGPFRTDVSHYTNRIDKGVRITWMGHSSLLIEIDGKRFLTDPVWSARASFSSYMGPKRFFEAPLPLAELPELDALILSHDHYDHLDKPTISYLAATNIPVICSLGVGAIIEQWGISRSRITEMDWTDTTTVGDCSITAVPTRHFSGRSLSNRNQTLWSAFVIKGHSHNIFFGADSGWFPGFKDIGDQFGPFDLTMLEIGAYGEGWPDIHMGPEHASEAHLALRGKIMMPIHWGTFNLAFHAWDEPIRLLQGIADCKQISLFAPEPGKPTLVSGPHLSGWWE